jgi:hypothetical protein
MPVTKKNHRYRETSTAAGFPHGMEPNFFCGINIIQDSTGDCQSLSYFNLVDSFISNNLRGVID